MQKVAFRIVKGRKTEAKRRQTTMRKAFSPYKSAMRNKEYITILRRLRTAITCIIPRLSLLNYAFISPLAALLITFILPRLTGRQALNRHDKHQIKVTIYVVPHGKKDICKTKLALARETTQQKDA